MIILQVRSQASTVEMIPHNGLKAVKWEVFVEKPGIWGQADFTKNSLEDHINTTKDTTDYLWYTTRLVYNRENVFKFRM